MANLRKLVEVSNSFNKPLRIAEMNSISNSGRDNVSNVLAAALWTLDASFEVAAAGAVGVNLHQGAGQNYCTALLRTYNKSNQTLAPVTLRPAFYGMMIFQQAVGAGSYLLDQQQISSSNNSLSTHVKLWPLLDVNSRQLRVVVINKHASLAGSQVICISSRWTQKYAARAKITRLVADGANPLSAKNGITMGGYFYGSGGKMLGSEQFDCANKESRDGTDCWEVYMPAASAALVETSNLPPASV